MRTTATLDLGQQLIQIQLNRMEPTTLIKSTPIMTEEEEMACIWKFIYRILDHVILLSCIFCLLFSTKDVSFFNTNANQIKRLMYVNM